MGNVNLIVVFICLLQKIESPVIGNTRNQKSAIGLVTNNVIIFFLIFNLMKLCLY